MARHLELTGERYGSVVALEYAGNNTNRQAMWKVRCDCGTVKVVTINKFRAGLHKTCGCDAVNIPVPMIGKSYGRLTVRSFAGIKNRHYLWSADCSCGATNVIVSGAKLRNGHTHSCGCFRATRQAECAKHGMSKIPEYEVWKGMWQRCTYEKHASWKNYGGRGITVCARWRSFEMFILDMGPRPDPRLLIERLNNDAGYSPENCVWATRAEQALNKRPRADARRTS